MSPEVSVVPPGVFSEVSPEVSVVPPGIFSEVPPYPRGVLALGTLPGAQRVRPRASPRAVLESPRLASVGPAFFSPFSFKWGAFRNFQNREMQKRVFLGALFSKTVQFAKCQKQGT